MLLREAEAAPLRLLYHSTCATLAVRSKFGERIITGGVPKDG